MFMKLKHIAPILFFFLICCDTSIEFDIPEKPKVLVVNSTLVPSTLPGVKFLKIDVDYSFYVFDTISETKVTDAKILLYRNGILEDTLLYDSTSQGYELGYLAFQGPIAGDIYDIEVHATGFPVAYSSTFIPEKVAIEEVLLVPAGFTDSNGFIWSEVTLSFTDPGQGRHFYEVMVVKNGQFYDYRFPEHFTNEAFITSESYYPSPVRPDLKAPASLLFNNDTFKGEEMTFTFFFRPNQSREGSTFFLDWQVAGIQLRHITEEYYHYRTSLLQSWYHHQDDFFYGIGEPLNVYTNITNGFGLFGGFNEDIRQIEIQQMEVP